MSKPIGTSKLLVRPPSKGSWGIWRMNEEGIPYPLLTFPDLERAINLGKGLGKILNLSCEIRDKECAVCHSFTTKLTKFWDGKKDIQICLRCSQTLNKKGS